MRGRPGEGERGGRGEGETRRGGRRGEGETRGGGDVGGLGCDCFFHQRKLAEGEFLELNLSACIVNINSNQNPVNIVIKDNTLRDLSAFCAGLFRKVYVQGIGVRVIADSHGLNPLSGKRIVYCDPIFEGDDSQDSTSKLFDYSPETNPVVLL